MANNNEQKKKSESSTQIATRITCIILVVLMLLGSVVVVIQSILGSASVKGEAVVEQVAATYENAEDASVASFAADTVI